MTETIRYAAYGYPMAGTVDGNWVVAEPDSLSDGDWGTFRIEAGATWTVGTASITLGTAGIDITLIGSVPTILESMGFAEWGGETVASLTLPELAPFDDPAAIGIYPGGNIDIYRVLPAAEAVVAGTAEVGYWHGIVASLEVSDGHGLTSSVTVQCVGALYGETSMRAHQPTMYDTVLDAGSWAGRALSPILYERPFTPFTRFFFESETTGIEVRYRGSRGQMVVDYLDELLALSQDADAQWTIRRAYQALGSTSYPRARWYYLNAVSEELAGAVQQNTVFAGGYGVNLSLSYSADESFTTVYGEGIHPVDSSDLSGSRWRNAVYPGLTQTMPSYPDRVSGSDYPITSGDTDGDFTTDVITQLTSQLRSIGAPSVTIGTAFTATVGSAIAWLKEDLGYANTNANIGGTAEWAWLYSDGQGTGFTDLSSGWFKPLASLTETEKYLYTSTGDVSGDNPSYDPSVLRVDRVISYGDGITKSVARKNAKRIIRQSSTAPWVGTITLTSDPTDENGTGRSRLDIREGGWIRVNNLNGGTYRDFHISGVSVAPESEGFPVTLTVSTVAAPLLDIVTRLERNKAAKTDPAKSFYSQRVDSTRPFRSAVGWDAESGAGIINAKAAGSATWTIGTVIGAQYGSIGALAVDFSTATGYCFAIFGGTPSASDLNTLIPTPLGTVTGEYPSWWQHPDNIDTLAEYGYVESWGSNGEAAGYYPGAESIGTAASGGTATGRLEDAGSWTFVSLNAPYMTWAIWPNAAGTVSGTMRIVVEE
jgi:hypothetical protein